ncbi:MAG TPA: nitrilase-related carbon-nitrogen hydrolase [Candidatus Eisenbacteria bacterium]
MTPLEPWICLLLGGLFSALYVGRWVLQPAAWLAPIFFLHFVRGAAHPAAFLLLWLVFYAGVAIANRGVIPAPGGIYWGVVAGITTIFSLPFLVDRLVTPHWPGYTATLVFPVAMAAADYVNARFLPGGAWGSPAHSQYGDLPLVQVASVAGIHGITFLVAWAASVSCWAWDHGFAWDVVGTGVLATAGILVLILLLGAARLTRGRSRPGAGRTIRVAGIVYPTQVVERAQVAGVLGGTIAGAERDAVRARMREAQDWFLEGTAREARAGASLVVWPEADCLVYKEDEPAFLERVRRAAAEARIHVVAAMAVIEPGAARPFDNRASLIGPDGAVLFTYVKSRPVPGWEASVARRGDGRLGIADTPLGRIAVAICYDMDFPSLIRQAGRARADLLIAPANDWPAIKELHWRMATFRAVENRVAMVRVTKMGVSGAVDACGRVLAVVDETRGGAPALVAEVEV